MKSILLATVVCLALAGCGRAATNANGPAPGAGGGAPSPAGDAASVETTRADADADVAAIEALNERILGYMNEGDWQALNEIVAEDYVALVPGSAPIAGRAANQAANRRFLERWNDDERWIATETVVEGDLAFQRGTYEMTLTPKDGAGDGVRSAGNYLHIYQRQADGSWALTRAMAGAGE